MFLIISTAPVAQPATGTIEIIPKNAPKKSPQNNDTATPKASIAIPNPGIIPAISNIKDKVTHVFPGSPPNCS